MEKKTEFYCGSIGPWIPILFMLVGMIVSTILGSGGLNRVVSLTVSR